MKIAIIIIATLAIGLMAFKFIKTDEATTLKKGDHVPKFELKDQDGNLFKMTDVIGKKNLVIYFYPKDDTPGCTKEACKFRDEFEVFTDLEAMVIGISGDSPESHTKFIEKYNLPFTLLSDENDAVRKQFGVKGKFMDVIPGRVTFIADKNGVIQYVFDSMSNAEQHVEEAKLILEKFQ
jgi:peroxiredoxin Q/BCP